MRNALAALFLVLTIAPASISAERRLQLTWPQLPAQITGRKLSTVLTDSTELTGKVVSVSTSALVLRTPSNPAMEIPRGHIRTLAVSRPGWKWRVILPIVGLLGGAAAGGAIGGRVDPHGFIVSDGAAAGILVGGAAGAGLGYLAGHFADRHTTVISIVD